MPLEGRDVLKLSVPLGAASPVGARHPESPPLYTYLLDADDDLAQELDVRMRFAARQVATARVLESEPGECDLEPWFSVLGSGPGLLILDGLVAVGLEHHGGRGELDAVFGTCGRVDA